MACAILFKPIPRKASLKAHEYSRSFTCACVFISILLIGGVSISSSLNHHAKLSGLKIFIIELCLSFTFRCGLFFLIFCKQNFIYIIFSKMGNREFLSK